MSRSQQLCYLQYNRRVHEETRQTGYRFYEKLCVKRYLFIYYLIGEECPQLQVREEKTMPMLDLTYPNWMRIWYHLRPDLEQDKLISSNKLELIHPTDRFSG